MTGQDDLNIRLQKLAATMPQGAGDAVEQRLLTAFRARHRPRKRLSIYLAAAAACLAVMGGLYLLTPKAPVVNEYQAAGFTVLPYAQSDVPLEQPVIIRVNVPASEFNLIGMPSGVRAVNGRISADLLVGQDGVTRAVRFVP
jgi:hypothetical protein